MIFPTALRLVRRFAALLFFALVGISSAQDFAPSALESGHRLTKNGVVHDSYLGTFADMAALSINTGTGYSDNEGESGTYLYSKTSGNSARFDYEMVEVSPDFSFHDAGTTLLNFTSAAGGTYTTTGTYEVNLSGAYVTSTYTEVGTFTLRPPPVPSITSIGDLSTAEAVPVTISFTINSPGAGYRVKATSSNPTLLPPANIILPGSGNSVTLTPVTGQWGSSTIEITVTNEYQKTTSTSFVLTVIPNNRPPTIAGLSNAVTEKGREIEVPFTLSDINSPPESLTIQFQSIMPYLIPQENIRVSGSGGERKLILTPLPNQLGLALITVTASDGTLSVSKTFSLMIAEETILTWRRTHFGSEENIGDGADLNDFDGDGVVNLMEYALGTLPGDASSHADPKITRPYNNLTLEVTRPPDLPDIIYEVEVSSDLVTWVKGQNYTSVEINSPTMLKVRDWPPADSKKRFIRLCVTRR